MNILCVWSQDKANSGHDSKESPGKKQRQEVVKVEKEKESDVGDVEVDDVEDDEAEPCDDEEDDEQLGLHEDDHSDRDDENDEDEEEDDISVEREEDDQRPVKPQLPQTDEGTTLFVRNIPFDATEDDLRTLCVDLFPHYVYSHHS